MKNKATRKRALLLAALLLAAVFAGCGQKGMEVTLENIAKQNSGEVLFEKYHNITQGFQFYNYVCDDGETRDITITFVHNKMADGQWARFDMDSLGFISAIYQDNAYEKHETGEVLVGAFLDDGMFEEQFRTRVNGAVTYILGDTEKITETKKDGNTVRVTMEFEPDEYYLYRWSLTGGKIEGVYTMDADTLLMREAAEYHIGTDGTRTLLSDGEVFTDQPFTEPAFMEETRNATELRTLNAVIMPEGKTFTYQAPAGAYFATWWMAGGEWAEYADEACTTPFEPAAEPERETTIYYKKA